MALLLFLLQAFHLFSLNPPIDLRNDVDGLSLSAPHLDRKIVDHREVFFLSFIVENTTPEKVRVYRGTACLEKNRDCRDFYLMPATDEPADYFNEIGTPSRPYGLPSQYSTSRTLYLHIANVQSVLVN
jgi:hypothetical protein